VIDFIKHTSELQYQVLFLLLDNFSHVSVFNLKLGVAFAKFLQLEPKFLAMIKLSLKLLNEFVTINVSFENVLLCLHHLTVDLFIAMTAYQSRINIVVILLAG